MIETWDDRKSKAGQSGLHNVQDFMQDEIDDLRTALQKRDAEIATWIRRADKTWHEKVSQKRSKYSARYLSRRWKSRTSFAQKYKWDKPDRLRHDELMALSKAIREQLK